MPHVAVAGRRRRAAASGRRRRRCAGGALGGWRAGAPGHARAVERALATPPHRVVGQRRWLATAAALLLTAGVAAAAAWQRISSPPPAAPAVESAQEPAARARGRQSGRVATPAEALPAAPEQPVPEEPVAPPPEPPALPPVTHPAPRPAHPIAARQRAARQSAQRGGCDDGGGPVRRGKPRASRTAVRGRRRSSTRFCNRSYSGSEEAKQSLLSLADMLLAQGQADAALARFDAYLGQRRPGARGGGAGRASPRPGPASRGAAPTSGPRGARCSTAIRGRPMGGARASGWLISTPQCRSMMPRAPVIPVVVALAIVVSARGRRPRLRRRADATPAATAAAPARVVLVSAPGVFGDLAGRLLDLVDVPGGIEIGRAERLRADEVFRVKGTDAGRATVWVTLDGTTAWVRAADADRERLVFRELAVSAPLSELDRERLCQMLASGLAAIGEDGAGALEPGRRPGRQWGLRPQAATTGGHAAGVCGPRRKPIPAVEWRVGAALRATAPPSRRRARPRHQGQRLDRALWALRPGAVARHPVRHQLQGGQHRGRRRRLEGRCVAARRRGRGRDLVDASRGRRWSGPLARMHASDVYSAWVDEVVDRGHSGRAAGRSSRCHRAVPACGCPPPSCSISPSGRSTPTPTVRRSTLIVGSSPVSTNVGAYFVQDQFALHPGVVLELLWR